MKKALFSVIAAFVIAVSCFVVPASADDINGYLVDDYLSLGGLPVIYRGTSGTITFSDISNLRNKYSSHINSGNLRFVFLANVSGEWCHISTSRFTSANSSVLSSFIYGNNSIFSILQYSFSSRDFLSVDYTISNDFSFIGNKITGGTFDPIIGSCTYYRVGDLSVVTGVPSDLVLLVTDYNNNSSGLSIVNDYLCKYISADTSISGSLPNAETSSTAEIMTAPQSESDKSDGGHLKVSQSQAANGYTAFSFMLNDNSNYHNYSVKISSNTNQLGTIEQRILNENGGSIDTGSETLSDIASVSNWLNTMFHVWSENIVAMQHFDFEYMFNQNAQTDSALKNLNKSWLSSMCKNMNSLTYSTAKLLTFDELYFSEDKQPYLPCKVVSFALSDYINVNKDTIYKVEIIDNVTQTVLDYTYIATPVAMAKGAENYGTKVYNYTDYDTMKNDVLNNDPSNAYTSSNGDKMDDSDPDNGFNSGTIQGIYDEYSINDLSDALNQSVSNATGFVKMCTSLIPPEIMALIVGGIALLVLLRVLGR